MSYTMAIYFLGFNIDGNAKRKKVRAEKYLFNSSSSPSCLLLLVNYYSEE